MPTVNRHSDKFIETCETNGTLESFILSFVNRIWIGQRKMLYYWIDGFNVKVDQKTDELSFSPSKLETGGKVVDSDF